MLSPHGRMSAFQRAQMYSLQDANIFNIAVTRHVRRRAGHCRKPSPTTRPSRPDTRLVRSIRSTGAGWLRRSFITSRATLRATQSNDEQVAFCVPSGNFGNICAGHIARMMGLPISKLVLATNENDVLDEFFRTGVYRPTRARPRRTSRPVRRWIFRRPQTSNVLFSISSGVMRRWCASYGSEVDAGGAFDLPVHRISSAWPSIGFLSGCSSHADRLATIRDVWQRYGLMIDTHTADGVKVAREHRVENMPMIVLETAQAVKFAETIREALGREPVRPEELEGIENLPQKVEVVDSAVDQVKDIMVRHC